MADTKLTDLTGLSTPASGDKFYIVDISDLTDGAGGTPTATEAIKGEEFSLTTSWAKYTTTFTTNTLTGKTFGTDGFDKLIATIELMWGATRGTTYHNDSGGAEDFGGAGNIDIAQVQLCAGDVALPFMPKSFEEELRACQRYYEKSYVYTVAPGTATYNGSVGSIGTNGSNVLGTRFNVTKRVVPTIVIYNPEDGTAAEVRDITDSADLTSAVAGDISENGFGKVGVAAGADIDNWCAYQFTATAEL